MCGVVCIRNYFIKIMNSIIHVILNKLPLQSAIVLYIIATDNTNCFDIYYHLKVPKLLTQCILFKDTLL